ncbi:type III-B CRISPR module-associated protein Cmr3 [Marinobacter sp.]|uniref:type III-B CRISPR module-associated protein Cmr3 n=1 Tax=Marinobacter sp. TaxID=50741 RepID=UPI001A071A59|nr:type III-B CRISPR module-associated protein Cmr3 [Marinobacter sp.]MBE0486910.1 type III-B CRISPR module-associated protein Cmr3 [Marinobacter sp.]
MNTHYRFIEPLDVLFLRGNKLFGDPGSFGESLIPPWPSVAAGAIRSRMLADAGINLARFAKGDEPHHELGTPQQPGPFTLTAFQLARRTAQGVEPLFAPPADLVISQGDDGITLQRLQPKTTAPGLDSSSTQALLPILAQAKRGKPVSGYWLTQQGWQTYLQGGTPKPTDLVKNQDLWKIDPRVGVGLDTEQRSAADGKLFSMQAVALSHDVGFVAVVQNATPPNDGLLRLGGDGRAAALSPVELKWPEPDYEAIAQAGRCRLVLTTPGIFPDGWRPTGTDGSDLIELDGIRARLACAAVPRGETLSGWDLANKCPKPAQRAAPGGSVYWLDKLEASPAALRQWVQQGLWQGNEDPARRAEGYNRFTLAAWSDEA